MYGLERFDKISDYEQQALSRSDLAVTDQTPSLGLFQGVGPRLSVDPSFRATEAHIVRIVTSNLVRDSWGITSGPECIHPCSSFIGDSGSLRYVQAGTTIDSHADEEGKPACIVQVTIPPSEGSTDRPT